MDKACSAVRLHRKLLPVILTIGIMSGPAAVAATGVTICDSPDKTLQIRVQASLASSILASEMESLSLDFIDHDDSELRVTTQSDLVKHDLENDRNRVYAVPLAPRVSAILRHIFDESVNDDAVVTSEDIATGSPLAELHSPVQESTLGKGSVEFTDTLNSDAAGDGDAPAAETRLPGIDEEEERRFRRQMFRTDI